MPTLSSFEVEAGKTWGFFASPIRSIVDTFNRAATSGTLGISTNGEVWNTLAGSWYVNSTDQAENDNSVTSGTGPYPLATYDLADINQLSYANVTPGFGVAFSIQDANNWYAVTSYNVETPYSCNCSTCQTCNTCTYGCTTAANCTECGTTTTTTCNTCTYGCTTAQSCYVCGDTSYTNNCSMCGGTCNSCYVLHYGTITSCPDCGQTCNSCDVCNTCTYGCTTAANCTECGSTSSTTCNTCSYNCTTAANCTECGVASTYSCNCSTCYTYSYYLTTLQSVGGVVSTLNTTSLSSAPASISVELNKGQVSYYAYSTTISGIVTEPYGLGTVMVSGSLTISGTFGTQIGMVKSPSPYELGSTVNGFFGTGL